MKFVAVHKNAEGQITHLLTDEDTVVTIDEAMQWVQNGKVDSLTSLKPDGTWLINDGTQHIEGHNFSQLPEF